MMVRLAYWASGVNAGTGMLLYAEGYRQGGWMFMGLAGLLGGLAWLTDRLPTTRQAGR